MKCVQSEPNEEERVQGQGPLSKGKNVIDLPRDLSQPVFVWIFSRDKKASSKKWSSCARAEKDVLFDQTVIKAVKKSPHIV